MSLVAMVCPQCGANLEFDEAQQKRFCSFCGAEVVFEQTNQTINNTNNYTTNVIKIVNGNLQNDVDDYIASAEKYLSVQNYQNAFEQSKLAIDKDPLDFRGYFTAFKCIKATLPYEIDNAKEAKNIYQKLEPLKKIYKSLSLIDNPDAKRACNEVNSYLSEAEAFAKFKFEHIYERTRKNKEDEDMIFLVNSDISQNEHRKRYIGSLVGTIIIGVCSIIALILAITTDSPFLYVLTAAFAIACLGLGLGDTLPLSKTINSTKQKINICKNNIKIRNQNYEIALNEMKDNSLYNVINK